MNSLKLLSIFIFSTIICIATNGQDLDYSIDQNFNSGLSLTRGTVGDMVLLENNQFIIIGSFTSFSEVCCSALFNSNGSLQTNLGIGGQEISIYNNTILQYGNVIRRFTFGSQTLLIESFDFEFQKSPYNGFLSNEVLDALIEPDDNILAAGRFFTDSLDISPETIRQLCRIDSTGAPDPDFPMLHCAAPMDAFIRDMEMLSDGSYILTGLFTEFGGYAYHQVGKLNPDFSVDTTFVNSFAPGGQISILYVDSQDRIWINAFSSNLIGEPPFFGTKLIRLLANGEVDNDFTRPDLYHPLTAVSLMDGFVNDIVEMPDGKFILAGGFTAINDQERLCIVMIEDDGTVVDGTLGNIGPDEAVWGSVERFPLISNIRLLDDGKLLLGGSFSSFGGEDYHCLVRLQPQPVTTSVQIKKQGLVIYPNPATGHFTIRLPDGEGPFVKVEIFDLHGRVLRQWTAQSEFGGSYSVEGLSAGVYVVKVDTGENRFSQKLIVRP